MRRATAAESVNFSAHTVKVIESKVVAHKRGELAKDLPVISSDPDRVDCAI